MKDSILFVICGILLVVLGFSISQIYNIYDFNKPTSISINTDCKGLDLINSSKCLRNQLKIFYKYNISELNSEYSIERIKSFGATCWQFSRWYRDEFINLGFKAKTLDIYGDDSGHEITIAWTNNLTNGSYCLLDQEKLIGCGSLGGSNEKENI